jgi:hypothetical protein
MIVAWTGHRPDLFLDPAGARAAIDALAGELAEHPVTSFLVGGQRGVDTWAAEAAVALGVPFEIVLPFEAESFTQDWEPADRTLLQHALRRATAVRVAGGYTARNQLVAETADLLVVVWTRTAGGGTAETLSFARAAGTPIREIVLSPSPEARAAEGRGI